MSTASAENVLVGKVSIPFEAAETWIREYTDEERNNTGSDPYAFPAYDRYDAAHNEATRLTDGDLLAPVLLNVRPSLRTFYGLQRVRPQLECALAHEDLDRPLADLEDPRRVAEVVTPLYAVLDGADRPHGLQGTTLSKVLHRKRPQSLVLHDSWVRSCYVGDEPDAPVPTARQRSWVDYMTQVTVAIGHDLRTQQDTFSRLDDASSVPGELTHVRLLDILAWRSKGAPPSEDANL